MLLPLLAELQEMFETPAESADKVRPHSAKLGGSSAKAGTSCANAEPTHILWPCEEAHCPPAASENFPKLDPDFFTSEPSETQQKRGYYRFQCIVLALSTFENDYAGLARVYRMCSHYLNLKHRFLDRFYNKIEIFLCYAERRRQR